MSSSGSVIESFGDIVPKHFAVVVEDTEFIPILIQKAVTLEISNNSSCPS